MIKVGMYINERYEIIDKVGSGGMADVYKAKCHRLNRYVAIKVLKSEYSSDKNFVSKFRNEAQSAAGLSHPNIVNVYDVGEDNGLYYIVMELVEGITLKRFIERKGHLEIKEAVGISIQIAQGMEAAHANHIIHRDIKPQNIIISREGKVKVTDFGIARVMSKSNTLTKESIFIVSLDTFVALTAGLIIFPACFAFNVTPNAGPGLIFITLPNVFNEMAFGRLWGTLFFVFMSAAALTTVIAVLENIISYFMDNHGWERKKSVCFNAILLTLLTLPCILGFSEWSWIQPLGEGSCIMDLEDFIISNNLLPIGSLIFCLFCCSRYGWGWDNFVAEADDGAGLKFPKALRFYLTKILPVVMIIILAQGYIQKFFM